MANPTITVDVRNVKVVKDELKRLAAIEAAVCSPYGEVATLEVAAIILRRWAGEEDSERGESHGGTFLTNWVRGIVDVLEAKP